MNLGPIVFYISFVDKKHNVYFWYDKGLHLTEHTANKLQIYLLNFWYIGSSGRWTFYLRGLYKGFLLGFFLGAFTRV